MLLKKNMTLTDNDLLCFALMDVMFMDGVRLVMTEDGELLLIVTNKGITKQEINDFENRSIGFHLVCLENVLPTIMLSGAIEAELNFNPAIYTDNRFIKFLEKSEITISCMMFDNRTNKVVALREIYLDESVKSIFNYVWEKIDLLNLSSADFIMAYSNIYKYSVTELLELSDKFGTDTSSKCKRELTIPDVKLPSDIIDGLTNVYIFG